MHSRSLTVRTSALFILFCTINLLFRLMFNTYGDPCEEMLRLDRQAGPFLVGGFLLQPWLPIVFLFPINAFHWLFGRANVLYLTLFDVAFAAGISVVVYRFLGRVIARFSVIRKIPTWLPTLSYAILLTAYTSMCLFVWYTVAHHEVSGGP